MIGHSRSVSLNLQSKAIYKQKRKQLYFKVFVNYLLLLISAVYVGKLDYAEMSPS